MQKFFKRPLIIVIVIAAITLVFAYGLTQARIDNNNLEFIPDSSKAHIISDYLDETFGGQVMMLVGFERPYSTIYDPAFLLKMRTFADEVKALPLIRAVNSVMSTQYITASGDTIFADNLVPDDFSGTPAELEELKQRLSSWELIDGVLISKDGKAASMMITLDIPIDKSGEPEAVSLVMGIRDRARELFADDCNVFVTGQPIVSASINEAVAQDLIFLIPLVVIVLLATLFFSFRRWQSVFLVLLTVVVAVVWTIGAMPLVGIKLSIISSILPVILLAVGSAYGIHVVTHYDEQMKIKPENLSTEEYNNLVYTLVSHLIKPVGLAALTTLAGFISFCFTPIVPIRWFGLFASWGVVVAFVVAVTLIPSLMLLKGVPKKRSMVEPVETTTPHNRHRAFDVVVAGGLVAVVRKRKTILTLTALAVVFSIIGLSRLIIDNNTVNYFKDTSDVVQSSNFMDEYFGGSSDLSIVITADSTEELFDPKVLGAVDDFAKWMDANVPQVGRVVGFTDTVKRINQVFNVDEAPTGYREVASSSEQVASEDVDSLDFGFGDFGFGDFEEDVATNDTNGTNNTVVEPVETTSWTINDYTAADIVDFMSDALADSEVKTPAELVRKIEALTNYEGAAYYEIPRDPARYGKSTDAELAGIVQNYLMLLSGGDFSDYANDPMSPTAIRSMIQLKVSGDQETKQVLDKMNHYIAENFPDSIKTEIQFDRDHKALNTGYTIGGNAFTQSSIADLIVDSQVISIVISVLMVILILSISYKSIMAGIIGAIPIALAIMVNFAIMGFAGITLNIGTALIASLSVGIGIDYTIHIIDTFKREYQDELAQGGVASDFLLRTFRISGKAIIINAASVGLGFGVLVFSNFRMLGQFGGLIMLSMLVSATVSLTLIPVMLTTVKPKFIYGP
ncbi:MAG: MMPL family transporter [Spirochaetaceae bacterium]|jgi:predicted RND superfamily exporter protein|nr:MMPL family transporter [Spirochaetaceae bacterium]